MNTKTSMTLLGLLIVALILTLLGFLTNDIYFVKWAVAFAIAFLFGVIVWSVDVAIDNGHNPF